MDPRPRPRTAVVIVNWRAPDDVARCVQGVQRSLAQTYEVVVVDNGSMDGSADKLRARLHGCLLLCNEENLGFSHGANAGIRYALERDFEFVWLLNNDAVPDERALENMVALMDARPDVGIVGCTILDYDPPHRIQTWGGSRINWFLGISRFAVRPGKVDCITFASALIRSKVFEQIGLLDDKSFFMYCEDSDFCIRAVKHGWALACAPNARVLHELSKSYRGQNAAKSRHSTESLVVFFSKHTRYPLVFPLVLGIIGLRALKRLLNLDLKAARAVCIGASDGLRKVRSLKET